MISNMNMVMKKTTTNLNEDRRSSCINPTIANNDVFDSVRVDSYSTAGGVVVISIVPHTVDKGGGSYSFNFLRFGV